MNAFATGALFGWPIAVVAIFLVYTPRRAALASVVIGWLFLPSPGRASLSDTGRVPGVFQLPGIPEYSKITATAIGLLLGLVLTDSRRLFSVKWGPLDAPMLVWCVSPIATSLLNGLGLWDGISGMSNHVLSWGIPYVIGRVLFHKPSELREIAIAIVLGGLVYIPLCLWEIRMSPNLHEHLYGYRCSPFGATQRLGGYRPSVFMHSGLPVGAWMSAASICAVAMAMSTVERRFLFGLPSWFYASLLVLVAILGKSLAAIVLLFISIGGLVGSRLTRTRMILVALMLVPVAYILLRIPGVWQGEPFVQWSAALDEERAGSLAFRLEQENQLVDKALERPAFGWGGWGRSRVTDDEGRDISVTDGFWIISMGKFGLIGMLAATAFQVLPPMLTALMQNPRRVGVGTAWPGVALSLVLFIYASDNLLNAMPNPVFVLAAGALVGQLAYAGPRRPPPPVPPPQPPDGGVKEMTRLVFIQHGDYAAAWRRFREGGDETYRDQRHSVGFVESLAKVHDVTTVASCDREHRETLQEHLHSIGLPRGATRDRTTVASLLDDLRPDAIVARTPSLAVFRWASSRGVRVLPVFADTFSGRRPPQVFERRRLGRAIRACGAPCAANHSFSASVSLRRLGFSDNAIVPWEFRQIEPDPEPREPGPRDHPFRLFYAGVISEPKGVGDAIRALGILASRGIDASLTVAGGVENRPLWDALVDDAGARGRVVFLGRIASNEVGEGMRSHDAVLVPSRHEYPEGIPNTIFEALASRTPLVASDHPAFADRLRDGADSIRFKAGDPAALADRIEALRADPDLARAVSSGSAEALRGLYVGIEWSDLIRSFLEDPSGERWVEANSLASLARQRPALFRAR